MLPDRTHRIYCRRRNRMGRVRLACYIRPRFPGEFERGVWWVLATQHALIETTRGQA